MLFLGGCSLPPRPTFSPILHASTLNVAPMASNNNGAKGFPEMNAAFFRRLSEVGVPATSLWPLYDFGKRHDHCFVHLDLTHGFQMLRLQKPRARRRPMVAPIPRSARLLFLLLLVVVSTFSASCEVLTNHKQSRSTARRPNRADPDPPPTHCSRYACKLASNVSPVLVRPRVS